VSILHSSASYQAMSVSAIPIFDVGHGAQVIPRLAQRAEGPLKREIATADPSASPARHA
jgi:hypothetical protein